MSLTLKQAQAAVEAAHQKALDMGLKMNIAVVDAGANLIAFARMEGAWLGSIDIAIKKAKTARYFDMPTGELGKLSQPGEPLYGIEVTNQGLVSFPGGEIILDENKQVIGAIGASGSTVDDDEKVAQAGKKAVERS
ncbi:MAG: GlcG/HbpS family heme-binding protein [Janthinobacterium lividum]